MSSSLFCWVPCASGITIGRRLSGLLPQQPWLSPKGETVQNCQLFLPRNHCETAAEAGGTSVHACSSLGQTFRNNYRNAAAHVLVGACGIAVRLVAPCLEHKSVDPPLLVIDPGVKFVISLIAGHLGGGNELARHIAGLLQATAVISTESDLLCQPALDLFLQRQGIKIIDWKLLAKAQAVLNASKSLPVYDPFEILAPHPRLTICDINPAKYQGANPLPSLDWRRQPPMPNVLRLAPALHLGMGYRKNIKTDCLARGLEEFLRLNNIERRAIGDICTVEGKGAGLEGLAQTLSASVKEYPAPVLAAVTVPHPSAACGARFGQQAFSVCEGAALLAAGTDTAELAVPKFTWEGAATFALTYAKHVKSEQTETFQ